MFPSLFFFNKTIEGATDCLSNEKVGWWSLR